MAYDPHAIESTWQKYWLENRTFRVEIDHDRPKLYVLDMFPYPSGDGLHVGHPKGYVATDVFARYKRMRGFNVLHPMGWDAFGLPAEQHAVRTGQHPRETTGRNIARFSEQLQSLGLSYDWDREVDTTDPRYVKWTQWIFCRLYEQGLAYREEVPVNWCPALGTVLANEEVKDGRSDIGGHPVERIPLEQWMLRITAYADRLVDDLDELDWPEHIKKMQRDWIGRSEGARVRFELPDHAGEHLDVFTTRPDTLFGATYMVLAPEHPLVRQIAADAQRAAVDEYVAATARRSERSRMSDVRSKTGVDTGAVAVNPVNGERIPIWIADYVLASYGTGAIMAVPGHDTRDHEFAQTFGLPIVEVVRGGVLPYTGEGTATNSGFLDGLASAEAKRRVTAWLEERGLGEATTSYKLRDWLFSRQRYWGEPFPVLHLEDGNTRLVPDRDLPVQLPDLDDFKPTGDFGAPLERVPEWIETTDPDTGRPALRDPNTMPQWAGSCWYYLRYTDAGNDEEPWSAEAERYWMPVDLYVGGAEHAVLHLLYARFWHKVLYDLKLVSTKEPFARLLNPGMVQGRSWRYYRSHVDSERVYSSREVRIEGETPVLAASGEELAECWVEPDDVRTVEGRPCAPDADVELESVVEKMSKSRGNVVNPDDVIAEYGSDSMRLYEMFMGPLDKAAPWSTDGIPGVFRFLQRVYRLVCDDRTDAPREFASADSGEAQRRLLAKTVAKVGDDLESMDFNTAISALMVCVRDIEKDGPITRGTAETLVLLLAPLAPHLAEELWHRLGHADSLAHEPWPVAEEALLVEDEIEISVQVQGKMRSRVTIPADADDETAARIALADDGIARHVAGREPRRVIYVKGRLVNIVL